MTLTWDQARERIKDIERERHNLGRFAWLPELRTFGALAQEAENLEPGTGPWTIEETPANGQFSGKNWLIADMGVYDDMEDDGSRHVFLVTDRVRASEGDGFPDTDAAFIVFCRNNWDMIVSALRLAAERGA